MHRTVISVWAGGSGVYGLDHTRATPEILGTAIHMVLGDIPLPW